MPHFLLAVLLSVGSDRLLEWPVEPADVYWGHLEALCGQAFEGELITHPEGETGFVDQKLLIHVRDCHDDWIRIPFTVGEDRSRTWVLTRQDGRIELKHVHRHEDGTPDAVSMYGGQATNQGRANAQYFPADEQTRQMIEAAFSNVWVIEIEPGQKLTYGLWRLGTPRVFRIEFDLTRPVDPPPPPWGWID